ncbi:MAG: hypothetical protein WDM88_12190 [Galbitalea sp.]
MKGVVVCGTQHDAVVDVGPAAIHAEDHVVCMAPGCRGSAAGRETSVAVADADCASLCLGEESLARAEKEWFAAGSEHQLLESGVADHFLDRERRERLVGTLKPAGDLAV